MHTRLRVKLLFAQHRREHLKYHQFFSELIKVRRRRNLFKATARSVRDAFIDRTLKHVHTSSATNDLQQQPRDTSVVIGRLVRSVVLSMLLLRRSIGVDDGRREFSMHGASSDGLQEEIVAPFETCSASPPTGTSRRATEHA